MRSCFPAPTPALRLLSLSICLSLALQPMTGLLGAATDLPIRAGINRSRHWKTQKKQAQLPRPRRSIGRRSVHTRPRMGARSLLPRDLDSTCRSSYTGNTISALLFSRSVVSCSCLCVPGWLWDHGSSHFLPVHLRWKIGSMCGGGSGCHVA